MLRGNEVATESTKWLSRHAAAKRRHWRRVTTFDSPAQRLAVAVLRLAVRDAAGLIEAHRVSEARPEARAIRGKRTMFDDDGQPLTREAIQREALDWLTTPSDRLAFWCSLLGLDVEDVIEGVDGGIEHAKRVSRMKREHRLV